MNVYACVTLYHVYITLLQIMSEDAEKNNDGGKEKSIILLNANNPQIYKQYEYIAKQLESNGYYCDIRFRTKWRDALGIERVKNRKQLKFILRIMHEKKEKEFTLFNYAWNLSYVYSTVALLYKRCNCAIFIEEGVSSGTLAQEKKWKILIHKLIDGGTDFYKDAKLKEIRVQRPDTFPAEWKSKLTTLDVNAMIDKLNFADKKKIVTIMSQDEEKLDDLLDESDVGIVYSGPFSEDGIIAEKEKIDYIMRMCEFYKQYGKVILKLHPRDTSIYPVGENVLVLSGAFPSELLSLTGYQFKFAVAIFSGAVETTYAKYKINMNENFLNDCKFFLRDINGEIIQ